MKYKILNPMITEQMMIPATLGSAAIDLRACTDSIVHLYPRQRIMFDTGISIELENDVKNGILEAGFIYPRSGLGASGLVLANTVGVIDADYRGQIKVCLWNSNDDGRAIIVEPLMRVAQLVVQNVMQPNWTLVKSLSETERGAGGFGSTGRV